MEKIIEANLGGAKKCVLGKEILNLWNETQVGFFSVFFYVVACIRTSFLLLAKQYSMVRIYHKKTVTKDYILHDSTYMKYPE